VLPGDSWATGVVTVVTGVLACGSSDRSSAPGTHKILPDREIARISHQTGGIGGHLTYYCMCPISAARSELPEESLAD